MRSLDENSDDSGADGDKDHDKNVINGDYNDNSDDVDDGGNEDHKGRKNEKQ